MKRKRNRRSIDWSDVASVQLFLEKIRRKAVKMNFSEHAEDIAQEVLLFYFRFPDSKQPLDYAVTDSVRKIRGDFRRRRRGAIETHVPLKEAQGVGVETPMTSELNAYVLGRPLKERAALILHFQWGMEPVEIAFVLDTGPEVIEGMIAAVSASRREAQMESLTMSPDEVKQWLAKRR